MKTAFSKTVTGERKSSDYGTPLDFFNKLDSIFKFDIDPCALESDPYRLGVSRTITKEENGLSNDCVWNYNTFINPPFGTKKGENIWAWLEKMYKESQDFPKYNYVMLLPARIESNWFQQHILNDHQCLIYAIRGRLKFYNPEKNKNNDPHPIGSVLYIRGYDITTDMCARLINLIPGRFIQVNRSF